MFRLSTRRLCLLVAPVAVLALGSSAAHALTVPFTENFSSGTANWTNSASTAISSASTGGPAGAGDAYATSAITLSGAAPTTATVLFRGQDNLNSSNQAFVGSWANGVVTNFSFWVRQNSTVPMTFGVRVATVANNPAYSLISPTKVQPNTWTQVAFAIDPVVAAANPTVYNFEGAPSSTSFATVFGNVGKLQVLAYQETLASGTSVTFDLDKVQVVPEPASLGVLGGIGLIGLLARRRKARA